MAKRVYLVNEKSGRRFLVVSTDEEKREITLKGEFTTFVEPFDGKRFSALGYKKHIEEVEEGEMEDA